MNSKERGDIAVGHAISHYLSNGFEVCLPIGDKRCYDFITERDGKIHRVQVKFAGFSERKNRCLVGLRVTGGNQSYQYAKKYKDDDFDILFIYTEKGQKYAIPWKDVRCRSELTVESNEYEQFKIV